MPSQEQLRSVKQNAFYDMNTQHIYSLRGFQNEQQHYRLEYRNNSIVTRLI